MALKTFETRKTNGEVDIVVFNLIKHAYDDSDSVRSSIMYSLMDISQHQPELVVSSIASYISKNADKIDMGHRVQLLETLVKISETAREHISRDVASDVVLFAAQEMISVQDIKTDLHTAASTILVNLALCFPDLVIKSLLDAFQPGTEPHYYIVRTFAETAATNPISTVVHLRDILSRIIPVLGLIKKSPMKWIFSSALGRFAEAINFFILNADEIDRASVELTTFESDLCSAWDVLFSKWLVDGEPKVKFVVMESLGHISSVLGQRDFDSRFQKLAPTYLTAYKQEPASQHLPITLGMSNLLTKAVTDDRSFQNHQLFTGIMSGLHDLISVSPQQDPSVNPNAVRNTSEVLRCWEILGRALPDLTLTFIINKFQLKSTSTRIGSLLILRHFVNALDNVLQERRSTIMSSATTLFGQPELNLRSTLIQLIASMANQQYLTLQGAEQLVKFVCQQASIKIGGSAAPAAAGAAEGQEGGGDKKKLQDLKRSAEHLLVVLATKVPTAIPVLWPFLLELVYDKEFTHGISVILKCIFEIAKTKAEAGDMTYILNLEHYVNIPPPQALVARLFILLSQPNKQPNLGINTASAMMYLGQSIHAPLGQYWLETMPALIAHLEKANADPTNFNLSKWQDTILKVFKEGLVTISNESWLTDLVQFITHQIKHGDGSAKDPDVTRLLFRFLGATLSRVQNKLLIQEHINFMLNTVNHNNEAERRGVAQGLGMIGNPHLDMVLPRITELLTTTPEHRKSTGFFGFGAQDLGPEDEVKATATLCYGYITAYANPTIILSRLDVHILHNIIPLLGLPTLDGKPVKNPTRPAPILKTQLAKALELIAKTVHPTRLPAAQITFVLKKRDELVQGVLQMLDEKAPDGKPSADLRLSCLTTLATLTLLEPKYSKEMTDAIYNAVIPSYQLLLDNREIRSTSSVIDDYTYVEKKAPEGGAEGKKKPTSNDDDVVKNDPNETPGETLMTHVNTVWQALVQLNPTVDCVLSILTKLQPLLSNKNAIVRQRAMTSYLLILKKFVPKIAQEKIEQKERCFPELGKRVAFIMPRVSDSIDIIRSMAVECIQAMLYLDQLLSNPAEIKPRQDVKSLTELKQKIGQHTTVPLGAVNWTDLDVVRTYRYSLLDQCIATFASASTSGDVVELIRAIINKLNDTDIQAGLGLSRILSKAVSIRGQALYSELDACIEAFIEVLKKPMKKETKVAALQSLRLVTKMHFTEVLEQLLKTCTTPLTREYCDAFVCLVDPIDNILTSAGDWVEDQYYLTFDGMETNKQLTSRVLEYLCQIINETPLDTKSPTPIVMAATCALSTIFQAANGVPCTAPVGKPKAGPGGDKPAAAAAPAKKAAPAAKGDKSAAATPAKEEESNENMSWVFNYNGIQDGASQTALQSLLLAKYPLLISTLLMRLGTSYQVHRPNDENPNPEQKSMNQTIKAIKTFLPAVQQNGVLVSLEDVMDCCYKSDAPKYDIVNNDIIKEMKKDVWDAQYLSDNKAYDDTIAVITRMLILDKPHFMKPIIEFFASYLSPQAYVGQRIVATACLAEFLSHTTLPELGTPTVPGVKPVSSTQLQDVLIRLLLPKVADQEDKVRKSALRGLGNLVLVWGSPNIIANATAIITSCSGATEDSSAEVAAEAVSALTRISSVVDTTIISPMLVSICFRIRGAFDRKQAKVRKASFELFAEMCRFGVRPGAETDETFNEDVNNNFLEQLHTNVPIYLVHIWDKETIVRKAALTGLQSVATLLNPEIEQWVKEQASQKMYDYDDYNSFILKMAQFLCVHHHDRTRGYLDSCLTYFTSNWTEIRANSAYLTGSLIRHSSLTEGVRKRLNLHSITAHLVKLLAQQDDNVRNQTAKALSLLYDI